MGYAQATKPETDDTDDTQTTHKWRQETKRQSTECKKRNRQRDRVAESGVGVGGTTAHTPNGSVHSEKRI